MFLGPEKQSGWQQAKQHLAYLHPRTMYGYKCISFYKANFATGTIPAYPVCKENERWVIGYGTSCICILNFEGWFFYADPLTL